MEAEQPQGDQSSTDVPSDSVPGEPIPPPVRYDLKIVSSLRQIVHANDVYSRKLKTQYQITVPQLVCLLEIAQEGPLKISDVARRVYLSASTVVGIVDRLEERGLIIRQRDSVDRRQVRVVTTSSGTELARQAPSPLQDGIAHALTRLPELKQATIALSLERIVDLMESTPFADEDELPASEPTHMHRPPPDVGTPNRHNNENTTPGTA